MLHFEELYEQSEKLATKIHQTETTTELIASIMSVLNDYKDLATSKLPDEVKASLRNRYMGEIMFLFTAISMKDNVNVYAALQEEMRLNEIDITEIIGR